jgi:GTP cyclohydrolase I
MEEIMAYENSYNADLAKKLCKSTNPEKTLDDELKILKSRALELDSARSKMADGYKMVLEGLNQAFDKIDLKDPNLTDSPNRMARALLELSSGLGVQDQDVFSTSFPADDYNEVIILKNITFTSMCSHHFFPFNGVAHLGYLPDTTQGSESRVVGLSKLARIVDAHAQRPQLQERMCTDIINAITKELKPAGAMVVVEAQHGCLNCRGAKKEAASMVTSALEGKFKEQHKLREEFLQLIKG